MSGFIAGEASFAVYTRTRVNSKGVSVKDYTLAMEVSQKSQDSFILIAIQHYFNIGRIYHEKRGISKFKVTVKSDLLTLRVVPHFIDYPLYGHKLSQFVSWYDILTFT